MLHTVVVPKPRWKVIREINEAYRSAKSSYEKTFNEPNWKFRQRYGLKARTPEQKELATGMFLAALNPKNIPNIKTEKQLAAHHKDLKKAWGVEYSGDAVASF
jgi:hypothetical protein